MKDTRALAPVRHGTASERDAPGAGIAALFRRVRLTTGSAPPREAIRVAGVPLVAAVVVAAGPGGWPQAAAAARTGDPLGAAARPGAGTARLRAAAAGLHPVDSSGAPVLSYRVRPGDTLSEIALRAGTSLRAVLAANGLRESSVIRAGQLLTLPSLATRSPSNTRRARRPASRPVVHVVRPGDTVWALAHRHRIPVATVLRANRLDASAHIRPGRKLVLPGAGRRVRTRRVAPTLGHVVRRGETVTAIARRHGVSVSSVLAANHLGPETPIYPGRRLLVPADVATPTRSVRYGRPAKPPSNVPQRSYPDAVSRAAAANRAAMAYRPVPTRAAARGLVAATARRYGVDPRLALAVATMESGFDQRQVSIANAIGIMQVIPSSGAWASQIVGRRLDLLDAEDNVEAGVALLATLLQRADEATAIAGYYQGLAGVRRHGMYPDTRRYVATVRALMARY